MFLHLSFLSPSNAVLASTRTEHGGAGHPRPVILGKGNRMPRGMELGVAGVASSDAMLPYDVDEQQRKRKLTLVVF